MTHEHTQTQPETDAGQLTLTRLEQLRVNYEAALKAGRWQRPLMTEEQRQVVAELLADLALFEKDENTPEGVR